MGTRTVKDDRVSHGSSKNCTVPTWIEENGKKKKDDGKRPD